MTRTRRSLATRVAPALRIARVPFRARGVLAVCLAAVACVLVFAPVASSLAAGRGSSPTWLTARSASSLRGASGLSRGSLASRRALSRALPSAPPELATRALGPAFTGADGAIDGKVSSSVTSEPIDGIEVCAFEPESPALEEVFECTTTSATGEYTLEVPAGKYVVEFFAPRSTGLDYQTQFYEDVSTLSKATRVSVRPGEATGEIDAALLPGGEIAGNVTAATTNAPLANVLVCAFDETVGSGGCAFTNADGEYTVTDLATGDYEVAFVTDHEEGETTYESQYYDNATSPGLATPVKVTAGATTAATDDALRLTVPLVRSTPSVLGGAVVGQTLTVGHGSWTNHPTGFVDKWLRCASPASERCPVLATGASYTLQPGDVGSVIIVDETAIGTSGPSEPVWSPASAVVVAAPAAPITPAPAPTPASGVLSSTTRKASAAQLRSLLERLLVPSGRNAKIAQLLKHRSYSVSFTALSAGKLTISWLLVPKGAHAKPVLVAVGSLDSLAPGGAKLTIKLTAKGKSLLAHAGRLGLTAKGVLQPSGAASVSATRSFTLKR